MRNVVEGDTRIVRLALTDGTVANYLTLLHALQYDHQGVEPSSSTRRTLSIVVSDGATTSAVAQTTLHMVLTNTHDPVMDPELHARQQVTENVAVRHVIARLTATDRDLDIDGVIGGFQLVAASPLVVAVASDGRLSTSAPIDREQFDRITAEVRVFDRGTPQRASTLTINITVLDVNDVVPTLDETLYEISVPENTSPGTPLLRLRGQDADAGPNGQLQYRVVGGNGGNRFLLDLLTGSLSLAQPLDFEQQQEFRLQVRANDLGQPLGLQSNLSVVVVTVINVNEHDPVFVQPDYAFQPPEELPAGTVFGAVRATDQDALELGTVTYTLEGADVAGNFAVHPASGALRVLRALDREVRGRYSFTAVATDGAVSNARQARVNVQVQLADINDNAPNFTLQTTTLSVSENLSPVRLLPLTASDPDLGANATISFRVGTVTPGGSAANSFAVVGSELLLIQSLDRETQAQYLVEVQATDAGQPEPRVSTITLTLNVLDVNDNDPLFTPRNQTAAVPENVNADIVVTTVQARDADLNPTLAYAFVSGTTEVRADGAWSLHPSVPFAMHQRTGLVVVNGELDRERLPTHTLLMAVTDQDQRSTLGQLLVTVVDRNDNAPRFQQESYSAGVAEDAQVGSPIVQVQATDADEGDNARVTYSILAASPDAAVVDVVADTGVLSLARGLDRERLARLNVTVLAQDAGVPQALSAEVRVLIDVLDVNDNRPVFAATEVTLQVPENATLNTLVHTAQATDADAGANATVRYALMPEPAAQGLFALNSATGALTVAGQLDREGKAELLLVITATDQGTPTALASSPSQNVTVVLQDINDNTPQLSVRLLGSTVLEDTPTNSTLGHVLATDADIDENAQVTFALEPASAPGVGIDPSSGRLFVSQALDRETLAQLVVLVTGTDHGQPARQSDVLNFSLAVGDVNDRPPVFSETQYHFVVAEDLTLNSTVGRVQATDEDLPPTGGTPSYSLTAPCHPAFATLFALNFASGRLTLAGALDRETMTNFSCTVEAGDGRFVDQAVILVQVTDVNEHNPRFSQARYDLTVSEAAGAGALVGTVAATDADATDNTVTFSLVNPPADFVFELGNAATGTVVVSAAGARTLNRERIDRYTFVVQATDAGFPPRHSQVTVEVRLIDVNDNAPALTQIPASVSYTEDTNGTAVWPLLDIDDADVDFQTLAWARVSVTASAPGSSVWLPPSVALGAGLTLVNVTTEGFALQGPASLGTFALALRQTLYTNLQAEPAPVTPSVSVAVSDGRFEASGVCSVQIELVQDQVPGLTLDGDSANAAATFVEGGAPVTVARNVTVTDRDSGSFRMVRAHVWLEPITSDPAQLDVAAPHLGPLSLMRLQDGKRLVLQGPGLASDFALALAHVTYANTAEEPAKPDARLVRFVVEHVNVNNSTRTATVTIDRVNDAPVLDLDVLSTSDFATVFTEGDAGVAVVGQLRIEDVDNQTLAAAHVSIVAYNPAGSETLYIEGPLPAGIAGQFDAATGRLVLHGPATLAEFAQALRQVRYVNVYDIEPTSQTVVQVFVNDGLADSAVRQALVKFVGVNDPPLLDFNGDGPGRNVSAAVFVEEGPPSSWRRAPSSSTSTSPRCASCACGC